MNVADRFAAQFGHAATFVADAPGRINLIGEHTDYNDGYVLPLAIPQRTAVAVTPRRDARVRVVTAAALGGDDGGAYQLGAERPGGGWCDYVQGCTAMLAAAGHRIGGFEAAIVSTVPIGAGLSSSAALEVALLRALAPPSD
jgi:galactokinase